MARQSAPAADVLAAVQRVTTELRELVAALGAQVPCAETIAAVESAGRLMDAARVQAAGALAHNPLAAEALGYATPTAALAALAQVSDRTARERLAVAAAVVDDVSVSGAPLPPSRPRLAAALGAGELGVDAAALITRELDSVAPRVAGDTLGVAEVIMVNLACGLDAEGVRKLSPVSVDFLSREVHDISAAIDPDGARPREERAMRRRSLRVGRQNEDGLFPVSGGLMPEVGVLLLGLLEAQRRSPRFVDEAAGPQQGVDAGAVDSALDINGEFTRTDARTPDQRRHDALAEILSAAAASADAPRLDGAPVAVILMAQQADVANEEGLDSDPIATMVGSDAPVSRALLNRFIDVGGYRVLTSDSRGKVVSLSTPQRCFTNSQRLSIAARDGYGCLTPGCTSPHYQLQVHHVIPDRDDGPTHVDNGVLLCYFHHRMVDTGPWQYRIVGGVPEVRGAGQFEWRPGRAAVRRAA